MSPGIEIVARGVLIAEGHVLLCRNRKHGHSYLPGGHVDPFEAAAAALAREFVEEAALHIRVGSLLAVSENSFLQNGRPRHELNLVFHVEHPHLKVHDAGSMHGSMHDSGDAVLPPNPPVSGTSVPRQGGNPGATPTPSPNPNSSSPLNPITRTPERRGDPVKAPPSDAGSSHRSFARMFHVEPQESSIEFWWCALDRMGTAGFVPGSIQAWLETGIPSGVSWMSALELRGPLAGG